MMTTNSLLHKITKTTSDPCEHWTATTFACENKKALTIMSAHQVCKDAIPATGSTTAFMQQVAQLWKDKKSMDPCAHFSKDITSFVNNLIQEEHHALLMGKFNDWTTDDDIALKKLLHATNLADAMTLFHDIAEEIPTFAQGPNRLDWAFASESSLPFITATGHTPHNEIIYADHHMMFVKTDKKLITTSNESIPQPLKRGANGTNNKKYHQVYQNYDQPF